MKTIKKNLFQNKYILLFFSQEIKLTHRKLTPEGIESKIAFFKKQIEPEILKGTHSKISSNQHQINPIVSKYIKL